MHNPFRKETDEQIERRVMNEVLALLKRNRMVMSVSIQPVDVMGDRLLRQTIIFSRIKTQKPKEEPKAKMNGEAKVAQ